MTRSESEAESATVPRAGTTPSKWGFLPYGTLWLLGGSWSIAGLVLVSSSYTFASLVAALGAPIAYGTLVLTGFAALGVAYDQLKAPPSVEWQRTGGHLESDAHESLSIGNHPAVVVLHETELRSTSSGSESGTGGSSRLTGGWSIHWLASEADRHASDDGEALETWVDQKGQTLVDFDSDVCRVRTYAETLARLSGARLMWMRSGHIEHLEREELHQMLDDRLRHRTYQEVSEPASLDLDISDTEEGRSVTWHPDASSHSTPALIILGFFAIVGAIAYLGPLNDASFAQLGLGIFEGVLLLFAAIVWIWYESRTHVVTCSSRGLRIEQDIAGVWSSERVYVASDLRDILHVPVPKRASKEAARLYAFGDGFCEQIGYMLSRREATYLRRSFFRALSPESRET